MATKKNTEAVPIEDTPPVLAYRVGKLEEAVTTGLEKINTQLVNLQHDFATKSELANLQKEAETEHAAIRVDISTVDDKIDKVDKKVDKKIWVSTALGAIFGSVMTILTVYFFNNIGK